MPAKRIRLTRSGSCPLVATVQRIRVPSVKSRKATVWSEVVRAYAHNRLKRRNRGVSAWHEVQQDDQPSECVYCLGCAQTLDHLVSIVKRGTGMPSGHGDTPFNLVPCCSACNSSKGQADYRDWMRRRFTDLPEKELSERMHAIDQFRALEPETDRFDPSEAADALMLVKRRLETFFVLFDRMVAQIAQNPDSAADALEDYDEAIQSGRSGSRSESSDSWVEQRKRLRRRTHPNPRRPGHESSGRRPSPRKPSGR